MSGKLAEIEEEIRLTRENIGLLTQAKRNCDCEDSEKPHYHVLLNHDAESGDEYFETNEARHQGFLDKLRRNLVRLERRLRKLDARKR